MASDPVNNPSHYEEGRKYSPLRVMTDWQLPPLEWQCVKYLSRLGRKDSVLKDLDKVSFYLLYRIAIELGIEDDNPQIMVLKAARRIVKNNTPTDNYRSPENDGLTDEEMRQHTNKTVSLGSYNLPVQTSTNIPKGHLVLMDTRGCTPSYYSTDPEPPAEKVVETRRRRRGWLDRVKRWVRWGPPAPV